MSVRVVRWLGTVSAALIVMLSVSIALKAAWGYCELACPNPPCCHNGRPSVVMVGAFEYRGGGKSKPPSAPADQRRNVHRAPAYKEPPQPANVPLIPPAAPVPSAASLENGVDDALRRFEESTENAPPYPGSAKGAALHMQLMPKRESLEEFGDGLDPGPCAQRDSIKAQIEDLKAQRAKLEGKVNLGNEAIELFETNRRELDNSLRFLWFQADSEVAKTWTVLMEGINTASNAINAAVEKAAGFWGVFLKASGVIQCLGRDGEVSSGSLKTCGVEEVIDKGGEKAIHWVSGDSGPPGFSSAVAITKGFKQGMDSVEQWEALRKTAREQYARIDGEIQKARADVAKAQSGLRVFERTIATLQRQIDQLAGACGNSDPVGMRLP